MRVIDLTHRICEETTVYPGTEPPRLTVAATYENDLYRETLYSMFSHTGTHIDAPAHIFEGKRTLDDFPVSQFVGRALVVDASTVERGGKIRMSHLSPFADAIYEVDFLLFYTGYGERFYSPEYLTDYPVIDDEVLDFIIKGSYKGIGFDTISLDKMAKLTMHRRLFTEKEMINIENLTNLSEVCGKVFDFVCLPLSVKDSDGAPCRAIAIVE